MIELDRIYRFRSYAIGHIDSFMLTTLLNFTNYVISALGAVLMQRKVQTLYEGSSLVPI